MSLLDNDLIRNLVDRVDILTGIVERLQTKEDRPAGGGGDVVGPASAVNSNVALFDGITGKLIKDAGVGLGSYVTGPASAVSGNLASYNGTTGKIIADSGVLAANVVQGPASVVTGRLASYNGTTGKLIADSGKLAADVVVGPASAVSGNLASYNGTTGKIVQDAGILASNVVQGPASAFNSNIPTFNGTTGKLIQDAGLNTGTWHRVLFSQVVAGGDFNNALTEGDYFVASNSSVTNAPFTGAIYGKLRVYVSDGTTHDNATNWIWQHFNSTTGTLYMRYKVNGGAWQLWSPVFTNQTIYIAGGWPASPSTGQVVFRTDLGLWVYYDGARWLTANEYAAHSQAYSTAGTSTQWFSRIRSQYLPYITRVSMSSQVLTTNNGTNYYTVTIRGVNVAYNSAVNIHTFNTSADAITTLYDKDSAPNQTATPNPGANFDFSIVKTGSPGQLNVYGSVYYRFIIP